MLDEQVGKILKALKSRKDYSSTVIGITSDHGEMLGDAGIYYKSCFLDGASRVPFIIKDNEKEGKCGTNYITKSTQSNIVFKKLLEGIVTGDLQQAVEGKTCNTHFAVTEYDDEIMITKGKKKMVLIGTQERYYGLQ